KRSHDVQVVYGPGTFLNRSAVAIDDGIGALLTSVQQAEQQKAQQAYDVAIKHGLSKKQATALANYAYQVEGQQQIQQLEQVASSTGLSLSSIPAALTNKNFVYQVVYGPKAGITKPKARFAYLFPNNDSALIQVRLKSGLSTAQQRHAISLIRQIVHMKMFKLGHGGTYTVSGEPVVVS